MSQKPSIPQGTRDFGPLQVQQRKYILGTIEKVFRKYGFMPIETPAMENLSTLTGKYGDEGDQLLFKILNSGNYLKNLIEHNKHGLLHKGTDPTFLPSFDGSLENADARISLPFIAEKGLRYDLTVPFARYVVMNRNEINFPFKRYQMQPVWRADRPQKGRYREFWQCDADVVGSESLLNEAELLKIYDEVFTSLGLKVVIRLNNRKLLSALAAHIGSPDKFSELTVCIDKLDKIGHEAVGADLEKNGFTIQQVEGVMKFLSYANDDDALAKLEQMFAGQPEGEQGCNELRKVFEYTAALNLNNPVKIDVTLARGLSYYTGAIVEVQANEGDFASSIGGGGRYDNLTGIFGLPGVSGVGISFGLDRIGLVLENLQKFPEDVKPGNTKIVCCYFDEPSQLHSLRLAAGLRERGVAAEVYPDVQKKIGKQLDYASRLGVPFVAIIGSNEMINNTVVLKDLASGEQQDMSQEALIEKLSSLS